MNQDEFESEATEAGATVPRRSFRGRGALSNADGRFESRRHQVVDDGWGGLDAELHALKTSIIVDRTRTIIARNDSPDIPFEQSINPYRGCEHGCVYCFARPSHAYLGFSPGLDFETKIVAKPEAARLLESELRQPGYRVSPMALGSNTDPYQPVEQRLRITRAILEVLAAFRHPFSIVTKSALIERDLDILAPAAANHLVQVFISITTLDRTLARTLEPRAAAPQRRLETIRRLAGAGIPVGVLTAPMIPALNDPEMETLLEAARDAGAQWAGYVLLRLPHEVKELFKEWLAQHAPLKAAHVMSLVRQARGGKENDPNFGRRMRGQGEYAQLIARRFRLACQRLGLNREDRPLDSSRFAPPAMSGDQLALFSGP
jgi:DNA repair photolyase